MILLDEMTMVQWLYLEVRIEKRGPKWCAANLMGAMRRRARNHMVNNVFPITDGKARSPKEVLASTERRLAMFCAICGRCELAKVAVE